MATKKLVAGCEVGAGPIPDFTIAAADAESGWRGLRSGEKKRDINLGLRGTG